MNEDRFKTNEGDSKVNEKVTCAECKHFNAETNYCKRIENTVRPRYGCYAGENRIVTNGDKIREMSNEELSELLYEASDTVGCPGRPGHWKEWKCPIEGTKKPCDGFKCWLDWLNAEAKEEE